MRRVNITPVMQDHLGITVQSPMYLTVLICAVLVVNSIMQVALMHILYILLLQNMGYKTTQLPVFVQRLVGRVQTKQETP